MAFDAVALIAWLNMIVFQLMASSYTRMIRLYEDYRHHLKATNIRWQWFILFFFVVYGSLTASLFLYFTWTPTWAFIPVFVLAIILLFLDKLWMIYFIDIRYPVGSLVCAILSLFCIVAIIVLMFMTYYVPAILALPYLFLYIYSAVFCLDWIYNVQDKIKKVIRR